MKLGIIGGAGLLGATTAFFVGTKNIVEEIKLIDLNENLAMSHAMDMQQALKPMSKTKITKSDFEDLGDCDIILITASLPERNVKNRNEYLSGNVGIITPICKAIKQYCSDAIIISATNPVDVFNYVIWKLIEWNSNKFIGFSSNDTLRLKWATEIITGKEFSEIDAICVGEHGDGQVRLYSQMKYNGQPMNLVEGEKNKIEDLTANWFKEYQGLNSGRTSGWTSAVNLTYIIEAIVKDSGEIIPCSTILNGELGYQCLSLSMPVVLGKEGIKEIKVPNLIEQEKLTLDKTVNKISDLIRSINF